MIDHKGIVQSAWETQHRLECRRNRRRIEKERAYRRFLADPGRNLPNYESLAKARKTMIIIVCIVNGLFVGYMFFVGEWLYSKQQMFMGLVGEWFPVIVFVVSVCLVCFFVMVDFVMYRRWPDHKKEYCFIDW